MLRFCSLGSGSAGNALVVEAHDGASVTRVLVDNGFGPRQLAQRLARAMLEFGDLHAVVVTHEHSDHVGGVRTLLKRCAIPFLTSAGTAAAANLATHPSLQLVRAGEVVCLQGLSIEPFSVAHDAEEPLQFVFSDGHSRLGLATDLGCQEPQVRQALSGVDALILECNHDADMLATGPYPPFLKRRVGGDRGHLSNFQAAELLGALDRSRLRVVVAAHLSRQNNHPQRARAALAEVLGGEVNDVVVADQAEGFAWQSV